MIYIKREDNGYSQINENELEFYPNSKIISHEEFINETNEILMGENVKLSYNELVVEKIRRKYSLNDEIAILRQKQAKPDEYAVYYNYCEQCKLEARNESK